MQTELTKNQVNKIAVADTFGQMARIAKASIIKACQNNPTKKIIELCAPISSGGKGSVKANLAEMHKCIKRLKTLDYILFNQLPYEKRIGEIKAQRDKERGVKVAYDMAILLEFYEELFEDERELIDMLVFMPKWHSSTGACWEYFKAQKLGIETRQLKNNWKKLYKKGERDIRKLTFKI